MTIREALAVKIGMQTDPKLIDLALVEAGLAGAEDYTPETPRDKMLAAEVSVLTTMSVFKSFSEGDLSITYDLNAINARLAILNPAPVQPEAPKPTIRAYQW